MKKKVLFTCIHNSARSQMAEELLRKYGGEYFEVESAGFEPKDVNPLAVEVLKNDENIDISQKKTNSIFEFFKQGRRYNYVITVCDESSAERCPIFPGLKYRIHWSFKDPSNFEGTHEEKLAQTKAVKEEIKQEVLKLIDFIKSGELKDNIPLNWKLA